MKKPLLLLLPLPFLAVLLLALPGRFTVEGNAVTSVTVPVTEVTEKRVVEPSVVLPITVTKFNPWYKSFGTWVDDGRFLGFHAGDDIEMQPTDLEARGITEVPVYSIADGTVQFVDWVSGYGGVMIVFHEIDGQTISSLYGHIDKDSATVKAGDKVKKGQQLAVLGAGFTHETDGRRMHLHFALWKGDEVKFPGYVDTAEELSGWLDPAPFLTKYGAL